MTTIAATTNTLATTIENPQSRSNGRTAKEIIAANVKSLIEQCRHAPRASP